MDKESKTKQLCEILGLSNGKAQGLLHKSNWDINRAINNYYLLPDQSNSNTNNDNNNTNSNSNNTNNNDNNNKNSNNKTNNETITENKNEMKIEPNVNDLIDAIFVSNYQKVKRTVSAFLEEGLNIDEMCIFRSIENDDPILVSEMIRGGISPNCINSFGDTCLTDAIRSDYGSVVKVLLDTGADPFMPNEKNERPFQLAIQEGALHAYEELVKHQNFKIADPKKKQDLLNLALSNENKQFFQLAILYQLNPFEKDENGVSFYMKLVSPFVKSKCLISNEIDPFNRLIVNSQTQKQEIKKKIDQILQIDPKELDQKQIDFLFEIALSGEFYDEIERLIKAGFDFSKMKDKYQNTLLHYCAYYSNLTLSTIIVSNQKVCYERNSLNETPIEICSRLGNVKLFVLLALFTTRNPLFETSLESQFPDILYQINKLDLLVNKQNQKISTETLSTLNKNISYQLFFNIGDNFRIIKTINNGIYSDNYLAGRMKGNKLYRIVKLKENYSLNKLDSFFENEMRKLIKLNERSGFENFVGYFIDRKFSKNYLCLVFEYYSNGNLRELINKKNKDKIDFDIRIILYFALEIAKNMKDLHLVDKQVHKCLSSDSICITKDCDIKISNVLIPGEYNYYQTSTSFLSKQSSRTNNYFSFGVILYELLTGNIYKFKQNNDNYNSVDINFSYKFQSSFKKVNNPILMRQKLSDLPGRRKTKHVWENEILLKLCSLVRDCLYFGIGRTPATFQTFVNNLTEMVQILPQQFNDIQIAQKNLLLYLEHNIIQQDNNQKLNNFSKTNNNSRNLENNNSTNFNYIEQEKIVNYNAFELIIIKTISELEKYKDLKYDLNHINYFCFEMLQIFKFLLSNNNGKKYSKNYKALLNRLVENSWDIEKSSFINSDFTIEKFLKLLETMKKKK
ncbi:hypothetical protein M0812_25517 [Anaeramoeba flamelloides]|uniref:Protein kinase domain-containing protein n=1 Tax=Anaeramoeba flamelloides TaxID=1746091 RepID=A0AAV7YDN3_9EUKA|nr:hypothetical protein M0812_25517 [Anaeramoeba flamelloides]